MVGNEETRAAKGRFLTLKITSRNGLNPSNVFVWKTEYFSRGFKQNSRQDMQLVATVSSLHSCCHLNIEESKFCFPLRDDLRVHILCEQVLFMRAFSRFSPGISRYSYRGEFSCLFDAKTCDRLGALVGISCDS